MSQVTEALEAVRLKPLPVTIYPGIQAQQAWRLMQRSGHIGKILVRPHLAGYPPAAGLDSFCPASGAHVVLGGTGGFGLATALWLAEKGARTVIVASRGGKLPAGSVAAVAAMRARGVAFLVESLDVTSPAAVKSAFGRWRAAHGAIAGVVHSAMVLDDGLISGITPELLAAVLAPKVDGLRAVTDATKGDALQYLVAYSSATTFIGSPGQGAYVAANAFLEGLVQELRKKNVPALAVCWGAIGDVGVVERTKGLAERLRQTTGVSAIGSAEALQRLGTLLADPAQAPAFSVYSAMRWTSAARKLVTLSSPLFAEVFSSGEAAGSSGAEDTLNLNGLSDAQASEALQDAVSREVARILRLSPEAIDPDRPLMDVGLDSLMALELRLGLEQRLGVELPMLALGGNRSVRQLADRIWGMHKADGAAVADA
jgi:NAD(P)-dependent dehydrogenase (short-subunit alcohol dehydrogenase family)/acyl carrier protein